MDYPWRDRLLWRTTVRLRYRISPGDLTQKLTSWRHFRIGYNCPSRTHRTKQRNPFETIGFIYIGFVKTNRMDSNTDHNSSTEESSEIEEDETVVSSWHVATNSEVFPKVLQLHVEEGSKIADVTYGKGVFWENIPLDKYDLYRTDINPEKSPDSPDGEGIDCRDLPYQDNSFDVIVLDPPYAEGYFRRNKDHLAGNGSHAKFRENYSTGTAYTESPKYHQAVLALYFDAGREAKRVLRDDGTFIVKVGDEVSSNTQELTHIQITNFYERELRFYTKDLFVVERHNEPATPGVHNQVHARKNHSFFMIYEMNGEPQNVLE